MKTILAILILSSLTSCAGAAERGDRLCKSFGAKTGSSEYINCRAELVSHGIVAY